MLTNDVEEMILISIKRFYFFIIGNKEKDMKMKSSLHSLFVVNNKKHKVKQCTFEITTKELNFLYNNSNVAM